MVPAPGTIFKLEIKQKGFQAIGSLFSLWYVYFTYENTPF